MRNSQRINQHFQQALNNMKTFYNVIFVWFLIQLVMISMVISVNSLPGRVEPADCKNDLPVVAMIGGIVFPITAFTFIEGQWCWEDLSTN